MKALVSKLRRSGFTIVEMMVGLIIVMVGIMGFAGMTLMQAQGTRIAKGLDEAATLVQSKVESLNAVSFANLGNDASLQNPEIYGLTGAQIWSEGPMNKKGEISGGGPYPYYRHTAICNSTTTAVDKGGTPTHCGGSLSGSNRPQELACQICPLSPHVPGCLNTDPTAREKIVRVIVGWNDRGGKCHFKSTDAIVFSWMP